MSRNVVILWIVVAFLVISASASIRRGMAACSANCVDHACYYAGTSYWHVISDECRRTWHDTVTNGLIMSTGTYAEDVEKVDSGAHDCPALGGLPAYSISCGAPTGDTGDVTCASYCYNPH